MDQIKMLSAGEDWEMISKEQYIDLMEKVFGAYTDEHIKVYTEDVFENGLREHGYPRLTATLGILIAHGRKTELTDDFKKMMDFCCKNIPTALETWGHISEVGNDFSVKEIVFCLLELEKTNVFEKRIIDTWKKNLSLINPYTAYRVISPIPPTRIGNWAAYNALSEQMRKYIGISDESAFIDNQIKSQIFSFDENGMYRDPNEPMVYDMVTRLQLALALHFGFDGEARKELEDFIMKSADITLYMQSVSGEIPFGGRSNQFLHNEAFLAALCEFYASTFKKLGDLERAGKFKYASRMAVESILPWLQSSPIHHIKNHYDINSMYGCEQYAYFNKYMITTASWFYCAYIMADDTVKEIPSEQNNYIWETSDDFHKLFGKFNDYFVELEKKADAHYDSSGIGRIHKKGAPSAICLSVPFAKQPNYRLDLTNPSPMSICAGIKSGDVYIYGFSEASKYTVTEKQVNDKSLSFSFDCKLENGSVISQTCIVSDDGVEVTAKCNGDIRILLPVFGFDGEKHTTVIQYNENAVTVLYNGWKCRYISKNKIEDTGGIYGNRNGHYKCFAVDGKDSISVMMSIEKAI